METIVDQFTEIPVAADVEKHLRFGQLPILHRPTCYNP